MNLCVEWEMFSTALFNKAILGVWDTRTPKTLLIKAKTWYKKPCSLGHSQHMVHSAKKKGNLEKHKGEVFGKSLERQEGSIYHLVKTFTFTSTKEIFNTPLYAEWKQVC